MREGKQHDSATGWKVKVDTGAVDEMTMMWLYAMPSDRERERTCTTLTVNDYHSRCGCLNPTSVASERTQRYDLMVHKRLVHAFHDGRPFHLWGMHANAEHGEASCKTNTGFPNGTVVTSKKRPIHYNIL